MPNVQTTYNEPLTRGQVGQVDRTSAPFDGDSVIIGATGLKAGDVFKLDVSGNAIPLTSVADTGRVEGALLYDIGLINTVDNEFIGEYAVGDKVPYMVEGYIIGEAGEELDRGDAVKFNPATHSWMSGGVALQSKVQSTPVTCESGDLTTIKIGARL